MPLRQYIDAAISLKIMLSNKKNCLSHCMCFITYDNFTTSGPNGLNG